MKGIFQFLLGIAAMLVVVWVLSFIGGLFFWGAVAMILGAVVLYFANKMIKKHEERHPPKGRLKSKEESDLERIIREMEEMKGGT